MVRRIKSLRWFNDFPDAPIDLFGHLFRGVAKKAAGVCQFDLAGCFRAYVLELELADQHCQGGVAVCACFDGSFSAGFVPAVAEHLLAYPKAGCVRDQHRCSYAAEGPSFLQIIDKGAQPGLHIFILQP